MENSCITPNLFGISANPCDCFDESLDQITPTDPDWYKKSESGEFLDELESEGLVSMRASDGTLTCDKTLGNFYKDARAQAIKRTIKDAFTMIDGRFSSKRESFSGRVGGNVWSRMLLIQNAGMAGTILEMSNFIDGVFNLKTITIGSSITKSDVTVSIFRIYPTMPDVEPELIENIEGLELVANRSTIKTLEDIIVLPMEVDGEPVKYLFVRSLDEGETLPNTSNSCGCGKKEHIFNMYARFNGITVDQDADSLSQYKESSVSYGMSFSGSFSCNNEAIVCRMFNQSESFKTVFTYAAMYLAANIINNMVLRSPDINRWNMVNFDDIRSASDKFFSEYSSRLTWLAQNTDPNLNDCYSCGSKSGIKMSITKIGRRG